MPTPNATPSLGLKCLLFALPAEIRIMIYSHVLIRSEPIVFEAGYGPSSPPIFRSKKDGLCPALLRVNKEVNLEALPVLYSNNRFRFPEVFTSTTTSAQIAPFLQQIGSQASYIRHICIPFPIVNLSRSRKARLYDADIKNLELIRDACTGIMTIELSVPPNYGYIAAEELDLLNMWFEKTLSLTEIIINFEAYPEHDLRDDLTKISDHLEKMHASRWTVKITKKKWISINGGREFDNVEDWLVYENEQPFIEDEKQKQEREQWWGDYFRKCRDFC
jgi:hypothetical protein